MLCITCPNREVGFCGALDGAVASRAPSFGGWQRFRVARAGEQLATQCDASDDILILCTGWAYRYILLGSGRRQILGFLLPGDLFSVVNIFDPKFQSSAIALTEVQINCLARSEVRARLAESQALQAAIEGYCRNEHAIANELLAVLGQRSAEERVAYLLQHLMHRLEALAVIREGRYPFPLRQRHIADAVGLTPEHVNRVLGTFRERNICFLADGILMVTNPSELQRLAALS